MINKTSFYSLFIVLTSFLAYAGLANAEHAESIERGKPHTKVVQPPRRVVFNHEVFPKYPTRPLSPNHAFQSRPDSLGNRITENHLSRIDFAHDRIENHMRPNAHIGEIVSHGRATYVNLYRPQFEHHGISISVGLNHYNTVIVEHPVYVSHWHHYGFYGGFYYGFHPIHEIDTYFYNPMVYWYYQPAVDPVYYRNWYGVQYDAYPALQKPFPYHGVFYPTENLKQLLFGVSAMTVAKQAAFRESSEIFVQSLAQNMADSLQSHVRLSTGDIVVTHYEMLGTDEGVVIEGFVMAGDKQYDFKSVLDFNSPSRTEVFAPVSFDQDPNSSQITKLDHLNSHIAELRGEPQTVSSPIEAMPTQPTPGEIIAEPKK